MYAMSDCIDVVEKRRDDRGMTVQALAQKSGVPADSLYSIFKKTRKMTASEMLSIAAVLELTFDDFKSVEKQVSA